MNDPTNVERRQSKRVNVAVTVELRSESGFSLHATRNLSAGGAYFDRSIPFELGSKIEATLHLPGQEPLLCFGEVVNVPSPKSFGMGVKFLALSPEATARLTAFTESAS